MVVCFKDWMIDCQEPAIAWKSFKGLGFCDKIYELRALWLNIYTTGRSSSGGHGQRSLCALIQGTCVAHPSTSLPSCAMCPTALPSPSRVRATVSLLSLLTEVAKIVVQVSESSPHKVDHFRS